MCVTKVNGGGEVLTAGDRFQGFAVTIGVNRRLPKERITASSRVLLVRHGQTTLQHPAASGSPKMERKKEKKGLKMNEAQLPKPWYGPCQRALLTGFSGRRRDRKKVKIKRRIGLLLWTVT
ncbi:hypothetical protein JOB18_044464 [Solea senegalensis]|uniref:Uncharacterized protein n=1 Tax=Solea senegalensis TaxID=28829 RepID=A0AAV6QI85_SOLSE|nr:hypothetical protein JOB18_044464 [Solea senegalensis]